MTDEKFFTFLFACIGFLVGVIAMALLGSAVGGDTGAVLRLGGVALGLVIFFLLWRRTA